MSSDTLNGENTSTVNENTSISNETPFVYVKNDVDYSDYALHFLSNELSYFTYIQSYTTEEDVMLFICENGLVAKSAKIDKSGTLTELDTENDFVSIIDWVSAYKGEAAAVDYALDNVYIGEDLVPLWKVLVDVKEDDEIEDETNTKEEEEENIVVNQNTPFGIPLDMYKKYMILVIMCLYLLIGITILLTLSFEYLVY
jgi:hypothetical protein